MSRHSMVKCPIAQNELHNCHPLQVVDAKAVHPEQCAVHYFELLTSTEFTGTFSSLQYATYKGEVVTNQGYGRMVGPEPGEVLYMTGHRSDSCPSFR
ncbi:hypothetical protein OSTOST_17475 [Ostertagia ostertagi]